MTKTKAFTIRQTEATDFCQHLRNRIVAAGLLGVRRYKNRTAAKLRGMFANEVQGQIGHQFDGCRNVTRLGCLVCRVALEVCIVGVGTLPRCLRYALRMSSPLKTSLHPLR